MYATCAGGDHVICRENMALPPVPLSLVSYLEFLFVLERSSMDTMLLVAHHLVPHHLTVTGPNCTYML
jgi:hypothetical protein